MLTFGVDLPAHTACPAVFDRSVTTVDVEQRILEQDKTGTETDKTQDASTDTLGRPAAEAASAGLRDLLEAPERILHWVSSSRHRFELKALGMKGGKWVDTGRRGLLEALLRKLRQFCKSSLRW